MDDILFINYNKTDSCSFYRSSGIAHNLAKQSGHNIQSISWKDIEINWAVITMFDLIMFQRPFNKPSLDLITYIKEMNKMVWVDFDDNLMEVPPENPMYGIYNEPENKKALVNILSIADVITVTNDDLKQAYLQFNQNIQIIPNAFNDSIFKRPDIMPKRDKSIIWRGTETHVRDIWHYGAAINKSVIDFPDYKFIFVGYKPWFLGEQLNKGFMKGTDIIVYFKNVMSLAPDCVQVPLHDSPFNRSKSNIAFIEASYFGAVSIVPDWWDAPGALKYTDQQSYYDCLNAVCSGEIDIEAANYESWEYIQDKLILSKVNKLRIEVINSLI